MTTLEAAVLVPLVICFICVFLLGMLQLFRISGEALTALREESETVIRHPAAVIRNTDTVIFFAEKLQRNAEEEK